MEIKDILLIILTLATFFFGISWAALVHRARSLFAGLCELKQDYNDAVADGDITDAEKAVIIKEVIL